ncbi:uncharacterized protein BDV14DRAFT_197680 [Aspergillus stella-maris]|uniref:uncharacterized protein n=1 Tax=Aspergillus stella-maris TaxID=1810926 RepID=UPI003CCC9471
MAASEPDRDYGVPYVNACWALTALVTVALIFRYTLKAWAQWVLPSVSSPERVWGAEDVLYAIGYAFNIAHMALIRKSLDHRLGRHLWFLSDDERVAALKYDYISQPLAVTASMFSRCGMTWFLCMCFSSTEKHIRIFIIVAMIVQIIANSLTVLQIVLQCGLDPYRLTNRTAYFHYMIENYSILLATCGPIIRLVLRVTFDKDKPSKYGYHYNSRSAGYGHGHRGGLDIDLDGQSHTQNEGSVVMSVFAGREARDRKTRVEARVPGERGDIDEHGSHAAGVTIKTDITVHVD